MNGELGPDPGRAQRAAGFPRGRLGALTGWASAAVGLGGVAASIAMSPWFVWTEHALSDLGHPDHSSAPLFNAALVASGALNIVFLAVLWRHLSSTRLGQVSATFLVAGGASLAAVGVFDESYRGLHLLVSITYFTFVAAGIVFVGLALWRRAPSFSHLSVVAGAVAGAFGLLVASAVAYGAPFTSQAIPELIASLLFAMWTSWVGWMLWRGCFPGLEATVAQAGA